MRADQSQCIAKRVRDDLLINERFVENLEIIVMTIIPRVVSTLTVIKIQS